jgi:transposase
MAPELQTLITALLPPSGAVRLTEVTVEQASVRLQLTATAPTAACPRCTASSSSIHSRYQRHLTDLPWGTRAVHLRLTVRKFVCRNPTCARRMFTERLPALAAAYARKTDQLVAALRAIGVALGGNAGARLAARLRLPTSPSTLLRLVQAAPMPQTPALQAVGVDEWAWRRGHRYGTILVDLETHRVVDLLPDRSSASVASWLARHPTITVVCRDRSDLYADGIRRGAPEAVQMVDRFHLVQNLRQAVEAILLDRRSALQAAAVGTAMVLTPTASSIPVTPMYRGRRRSAKPVQPREEAARPPRHARWVAIYEAVRALRAQGTPIATMARQLNISRPTVYAYLRRDTPPGPRRLQRRPSARVLTPYVPYLIRRWRESGADSRQLWRELQALGYTHSARTVCRFITQLRRASDGGYAPEGHTSPYTRPQGPSARAVSFVMVCPAAHRADDAQRYLDQLCQMDPHIARAHELSHAFLTIVRERRGTDLEAWMAEAMHSGIEALARFARGLREDLAAVTAGLTLEWSNGVTEGQIHRLKLLKRQGYGRAGFALLRQRTLQAA